MVSDFGATHAAEKLLGPIRVGTVEAICFLVIDALHFKATVLTCMTFQSTSRQVGEQAARWVI
jgi:hypothetical protein